MGSAVIITGMHRSGTSLLANLLSDAGIHIGDRMLPADEHNVRGYFEDSDFVELHDGILADNGTDWTLTKARPTLEISKTRLNQMDMLVEQRRDRPLWGWKDPRTVLFLDAWSERLPAARFVFVFRSPDQVLGSLQRRGDHGLLYCGTGAWTLQRLGLDAWRFRVQRAGDLWLHYNQAVVRFVEQRPQECMLLNLAKLRAQLRSAQQAFRGRWGLTLRPPVFENVYASARLHTSVSTRLRSACARRHDLRRLHERLIELSEHTLQ